MFVKIKNMKDKELKQKDKKLRISSARIIWIFIALFFVMEAIFYFSFQSTQFWPLEMNFYIYTPCLLASSAFFCYISITGTYYTVDNQKIQHTKMNKTYEYRFKDIIYIDEEWSKKHKMLLFYLADGHQRYLAFDRKGIIFEYAMKYSHLISRDEFLTRFPKVKL